MRKRATDVVRDIKNSKKSFADVGALISLATLTVALGALAMKLSGFFGR